MGGWVDESVRQLGWLWSIDPQDTRLVGWGDIDGSANESFTKSLSTRSLRMPGLSLSKMYHGTTVEPSVALLAAVSAVPFVVVVVVLAAFVVEALWLLLLRSRYSKNLRMVTLFGFSSLATDRVVRWSVGSSGGGVVG